MKFSQAKRIEFWCFIATGLTNLGRADDSEAGSPANLDIQASMVTTGGWGDQFPMAAVSMKNWPFAKTISAADYVAAAMKEREATFTALERDVSPEGNLRFEAFKTLFCDKAGKLHKLTVANSYWVHSGHQRTQFDYVPAYEMYLKRVRDINKMDAEDKPVLTEWVHGIPCVIGEYVDELDILKDQLIVNTAAGKQNRLKILDLFQGATVAIGNGTTPAVSERQYRDFCASSPNEKGDKGNSGAGPRQAYLMALINYYYSGKLFFKKHLLAPKMISDAGGKKVPNPEYVDVNEVALGHFDPMCNVSVIARLMESKLEKLKQYIKTYGKKGEKDDPVSAIEYAIATRGPTGNGVPWSLEESKAWLASRCKNADKSVRAEPLKAPKDVVADIKVYDGLRDSDRNPEVIRDVLAKHSGKMKDLVTPIDANVDDRVQAYKDPLDGVWKLDIANPFDKMLLDCITSATGIRDGNPKAYKAVLPKIKEMLDGVTQPQKKEETEAADKAAK